MRGVNGSSPDDAGIVSIVLPSETARGNRNFFQGAVRVAIEHRRGYSRSGAGVKPKGDNMPLTR